MKSAVITLLLSLALSIYAFPRTITASGNSNSAVQTAIDSAANGDTVQFSGTATWNGGVSCNKAITIDGQGATVTHGAGSGNLMNLTGSSAGNLTVAGINFKPGSATGRYMSINGSASAKTIIIHDCTFDIPNFQLNTAITSDMLGGLLYNCTFTGTGAPSSSSGPGSGSGCLQVRSPKNWYDPSTFGNLDKNGDQNLYVEDSKFIDMYNQAIDVDDNGRVVLRHSLFENSQAITHGITSKFGGRQIEIYDCDLTYVKRGGVWVNTNRYLWMRAGTGRIHDNTVAKLDSGGYWGGWKSSFCFIDEPLTRSGAGNGGRCETQSQYPGTRWPGTGSFSDGHSVATGQVVSPSPVDPIYVWDNSGPAATSWSTNDQSGYSCNNGPTSAVFKSGRDIIFAAAPGYAPYTYPHPLRGGGPAPTPTPQPTATSTPTPQPTSTPTPPQPTPTPQPSSTPTPQPTATPPIPVTSYSDFWNAVGEFIHQHPANPNTYGRGADDQGTEPTPGD